MFRLEWVIVRLWLEPNMFTSWLCPFWDPKRLKSLLHRHYITAIQKKAALYNTDNVFWLITPNVTIGSMARDFLSYVVSRVPAQLVCVSPLPVILLALSMEENISTCEPAQNLVNTTWSLYWKTPIFIVFVDDRVQLFYFAWFSEECACVLLLFVVLCYSSVLLQNIWLLNNG